MRLLAIRESIWLNAPPGSVWRLILSLEEWPHWNRTIADARWRGKRGWKAGHRFRLSYPGRVRPFLGGGRVSLVEAHREIRWVGRFLTFGVEFALVVEPDGCGTLVTFGSHFHGFAARFAASDSISRWMTAFQRHFLASLRSAGERVPGSAR